MNLRAIDRHSEDNQVRALEGYDAFAADPWLAEAVRRNGIEDMAAAASGLGTFVGSAEGQHHAELANRYTPELRTYDALGYRVDRVDYHPSYHVLMRRACSAGLHSLAWQRPERGFSARALLFYLWNQLEQGTACPVTMTFASIPVFAAAPDLEREWRPKVIANDYDPTTRPLAQKTAVMIGMAMTEKQGGSDLRAVRTTAQRDGRAWRLEGHKWFCSAPMSDAFFTLARLPEGVTCFLVARTLPDGSRNAFHIQRLKDKCGNRSNASAEIEFHDTVAWRVGEPGRGIATILAMAHHTRFDIVVGVAGMMRAALNQAMHHARYREAFGKRLEDHPLMMNVLADLALETEAATLLAFRLAAAFDGSKSDPLERELQRALTPVAKYWLCKRMTPVATEAMECLGGNGYVEESPLARGFREAPLNGIWEGSANVICLDALRALSRAPEAMDAIEAEVDAAKDERLRALVVNARRSLAQPAQAEAHARRIVADLAIATQCSLMKRYADADAAEAFCASRLGDATQARAFGALELDSGRLAALAARGRLGL